MKKILLLIITLTKFLWANSLDDLIKIAFKNNIELKILRLQLKNSNIDLKKSENSFIPDLNVTYYNSKTILKDSFSKSLSGKSNYFDTMYSFKLTQKFSALGKINKFKKDIANLKKNIIKTMLNKAELSIEEKIVKLYFNLFKLKETIKIHKYNLKLINQLLEVAKINKKVGLALYNDVLRIEVLKSNQELAILKAENNYKNTYEDLKNILNTDKFEVEFPEDLKYTEYKISKDIENKMLGNDHDILLAKLDFDIYKKGVDSAKSIYYPDLNIDASYNLITRTGGIENNRRNYKMGLAVSVPLYNSGDIGLEIKRAYNNLEIYRLKLLNLENTKKTLLNKAIFDYKEVLKRIKTIEKNLEQSKENMRIVSERYSHGSASIVDVIDAQITLTDTGLNLINAYYDERIRLSKILTLINDKEAIKKLSFKGKNNVKK